MKTIEYSIYLVLASMLYSCQSSINHTMEKPNNQDSISCTKLVYAFFLSKEKITKETFKIINLEGKFERIEIPTPKFYEEFSKENLEKDISIYFNGHKSLTEQLDNHYCFWSKTTSIRDTSAWITIHKPLKYVHFWDKYQEALPVCEEKPDSPTFNFTKINKQILDYTCEQVIVESSSNKKICWFTKQLQLKDPTQVLIQYDSIPGTILEMEEYWLKFNQGETIWQYVKTTHVKSIEQVKVPANFFEVPKGAQKMDSEQAQKLNTKRIQEANRKEKQLSLEEKNKFLGIWTLRMDDYGLQIEINELGNNSYEFTEKYLQAGHLNYPQKGKAAFYGSILIVNDCIRYKLTPEGKLQEVQNSFFTYSKVEDENQLLLNSLNYWVRGGGDSQHPIKNLKSTGESNSRVEDYKQKIAKKDLKIKWVNGKYEFEK